MNTNRSLTSVLCMLLCWGLAACAQGTALLETPADTPHPPPYPAVLPSPGAPGTLQLSACRFALPEEHIQGEDVDCYYLTVDEQREDGKAGPSSGRVIRLAVAVFHPPEGATQLDPVIYLSGGPGVGILEMLRWQFEDMSEPVFAGGRDLIFFDQRGIGLSIPALDCPEYDELALDFLDHRVDGQQIDEQQMSELLLDSLGECRDELSKQADLTAYNSAASARDVEDLRKALGYQQVNLWGGSYGTRLALEVMRRYPESLRSVVLDAVYPPDVDLYQESPANFSRSLERLFAACAENQVCSEAYPDLRQVYFEMVRKLSNNPVEREIQNPMTGEVYNAWLDGNTMLGLTFQLLYDSKLRYLLPKQIYAASQGEYQDFDLIQGIMIALLDYSYRGMMYSVQCHDELAFSSVEGFRSLDEDFPELVQMYNNTVLGDLAYRVCQEWGVGMAEASANQAVIGSVPTLLLTGEFDPITPPEWGKHAAETLERGYFFEFPGIGHGASLSDDCPMGMMVEFLKNPDSSPDASCISAMK